MHSEQDTLEAEISDKHIMHDWEGSFSLWCKIFAECFSQDPKINVINDSLLNNY